MLLKYIFVLQKSKWIKYIWNFYKEYLDMCHFFFLHHYD